MKVLVTGSTGQLGRSILKVGHQFPQYNIIAVDRAQLDLSKPHEISSVLSKFSPQVIINTAAYTAVDKAEDESDLVNTINHLSVKAIGNWCLKNKAKLIHVSTDYVFEGNKTEPYLTTDPTNPINVYGKTKCLGEQALLQLGIKNAAIIRTSWVWSEFGNNFVKTMLRLMNERQELSVVDDQIGSPTYAGDLATVILTLIAKLNNKPIQVYHYSNAGECSWFDFAKAIAEISNSSCLIKPISTAMYPTKAKRPKFTVMSAEVAKEHLSLEIPKWRTSLEKGLKQLIEF